MIGIDKLHKLNDDLIIKAKLLIINIRISKGGIMILIVKMIIENSRIRNFKIHIFLATLLI